LCHPHTNEVRFGNSAALAAALRFLVDLG